MTNQPDIATLSEAQNLFEFSQSIRRDLHQHPELGYQENRTAGLIAKELTQLGMEVTTGIARTGVVGLLEGNVPGPVVLVRFDMDALPILEESGAAYASQSPGVMHACGHDGHVATGLSVARILAAHKEELSGTVKFVFQPAEEGLGGAEEMIREGVLESPKVDYSLALHIWNEKPLGWMAVVPGPFMAASETFSIQIHGKGGHGALPHLATDPVFAAAQWISAVQSIVSRNVSPLQPAVISVTSIHAGETFNVIPPTVTIQGTIRSFDRSVRQTILERFEKILTGITESLGCTAEMKITSLTPAMVNDALVTSRVQEVARTMLPDSQLDTQYQTMGSDDMAYLLDQVPGCYFMIGSANPDKGLTAGHHHPKFDFDEEVLPRAAALMAGATIRLLEG